MYNLTVISTLTTSMLPKSTTSTITITPITRDQAAELKPAINAILSRNLSNAVARDLGLPTLPPGRKTLLGPSATALLASYFGPSISCPTSTPSCARIDYALVTTST